MFFCSEDKRDILSKQVLNHSEEWHKTFRTVMFWRPVAKNELSAKLDGLLLGLLDGLVRCSTVLHRQHLKRPYDQANDFLRIFVWHRINVGQLHHFGKLFDGSPNDRKNRFLLQYRKTNDIYSTVVSIVETLPYPQLTMILISITMIAFMRLPLIQLP